MAVRIIEPDPTQTPAEIATAFDLMREVAVAVRAVRGAGQFPVVLCGNCNTAVGTLSGLTPARRAIFWFDAHADCNTPDTTTSGFADGTGLATALGKCWHQLCSTVPGYHPVETEATFLFGVRDLDPPEATFLAGSAITSMPNAYDPASLPTALARAQLTDANALAYLHLDMDVLDPMLVGQANSLPVPDGLSVEQLTASILAIRAHVTLGAAAVSSYAPEYDTRDTVCKAAFAAIDAILTDGPATIPC